MNPLYYFIIADVVIIIIAIRIIFGSYTVFIKSLADHFYPDEVLPNPLDEFAVKHDSKHKINILYAVLLFLAGITFAMNYFLFS